MTEEDEGHRRMAVIKEGKSENNKKKKKKKNSLVLISAVNARVKAFRTNFQVVEGWSSTCFTDFFILLSFHHSQLFISATSFIIQERPEVEGS